METDKQLYRVFGVQPDWVFELAGLPPVGKCVCGRSRLSKLKKEVKEALEEVFVSWLLQRLPDRSKKEIEKMLIGELPELVDTRAGQDILKIGEEGAQDRRGARTCRGCGHPAGGQAGTADEVPAAEAPDVGGQATASTAGGCHPVGVPRPAGCLAGGARQVNRTASRRVRDETFLDNVVSPVSRHSLPA